MSDFRKIFLSGISWKALFYFTSFFLNVIIANLLGAADTGIFFYLLNNLSIIIFMLSLGVDSSINYFNARKEIAYDTLLSIGLLWSVAGCILFAALIPVFTATGLIPPIARIEYVLLFVFGAILTANLSSLFYSSNDNRTPNIIPGLINAVLIILIALKLRSVNVISTNKTLFELYLASGFVAGFILLLIIIKRANRVSLQHGSGAVYRQFIRYSWSVFLANVFITLLLRSDVWLVKAFCSDADLGNYIQTAKFLQLVLIIPTLASFTLFPLITQNIEQGAEIGNRILKLISTYIYLALAMCIGIALAGRWLFPFLYGPTFSKMYLTFILFIPGIIALAASYPLTPFFSGKNMNRIITNNSLGAIAIMGIADFILIPNIGIYGAAIGSTLAYTFYFFRLLYVFKKIHTFEVKEVFHFDKFYNELLIVFQQRAGR